MELIVKKFQLKFENKTNQETSWRKRKKAALIIYKYYYYYKLNGIFSLPTLLPQSKMFIFVQRINGE